jgi:hypothetical protein
MFSGKGDLVQRLVKVERRFFSEKKWVTKRHFRRFLAVPKKSLWVELGWS